MMVAPHRKRKKPAPSRTSDNGDTRLCSTDFLPNFAALAGAQPPPGLDGLDATAALEGKPVPARDALYWHYPHYHEERPCGAILKGDWKLIEYFETGKAEFFHLTADPQEQKDLAAENPTKATELLTDLKAWHEKVGAQMMSPNPGYDPAREKEGPPKKPKKEKPAKGKDAKKAKSADAEENE